jgi:FkbM family methyltransferase
LRNPLKSVRWILEHPLNRGQPVFALSRLLRWQLGSRLVPGAVAVPFVGGARLLVKRGMTGATGNVYCGLHEFEDMAFVMHVLRAGDLFVDVGANIGSYTVLAAGACGASVVAIEPIPSTFAHLLDNIHLNDFDGLVTAKNIGLGETKGMLRFSKAMDTVNHVLSDSEAASQEAVSVAVDTMDAVLAGSTPSIIKIDVEGFETPVLRGAEKTLRSDALLAVLMELNGSGGRYGFDEVELHEGMVRVGFTPCTYDPFARVLRAIEGKNASAGNTLYVRDIEAVRDRVRSAPYREVHGRRL